MSLSVSLEGIICDPSSVRRGGQTGGLVGMAVGRDDGETEKCLTAITIRLETNL